MLLILLSLPSIMSVEVQCLWLLAPGDLNLDSVSYFWYVQNQLQVCTRVTCVLQFSDILLITVITATGSYKIKQKLGLADMRVLSISMHATYSGSF